ncbi:MAG: polyphosphate kinase 2 family protein [Siphonobacter sp.]
MKLPIDTSQFEVRGSFKLKKYSTKIDDLYASKEEYENLLAQYRKEIDELQTKMYAHNRYGLLLIFQAMDAAGKDGTIGHVMSGVNPFGVEIFDFKRPTELEQEHDFLWRTSLKLPRRGTITIFNRSYYEEVLVVKVHPEILLQNERIPEEFTDDLDDVWKHRYEDINALEKYLHRNGIIVMKFFLNVSKKEQGKRLIERINDLSKNWKFEEGDVKERGYWDDYMKAYEDAIQETSTKNAPWYVIPADDKKNMRLIVSKLILEKLKTFKMEFPEASEARQKELKKLIATIEEQDKD